MKRFFMLSALLMLAAAGSAIAQNGATVQRWDACGYYFYNPCCDEVVELCLDVQVVISKDGYIKSGSAKGTGVGSTGTRYQFADNTKWDASWKPVGANQYTFSSRVRLVSTGNANCSFFVTIQWLVTVNANGETTATIDRYEVECGNGTIL
jgi:hypothetical protein